MERYSESRWLVESGRSELANSPWSCWLNGVIYSGRHRRIPTVTGEEHTSFEEVDKCLLSA